MVRPATVVVDGGPLDELVNLVVQVSRWDRLKDMEGVLDGFAAGVAGRVDAQLALVGPVVGVEAGRPRLLERSRARSARSESPRRSLRIQGPLMRLSLTPKSLKWRDGMLVGPNGSSV